MTTTTIRLPADIKARIAQVALAENTNAHSFILQAISEKLTMAEQEAAFHSMAQQRYDRIAATGEAIAWADMRQYLEARAAGTPTTKPKARKLGA
jgi:predicted transcriptional regulator